MSKHTLPTSGYQVEGLDDGTLCIGHPDLPDCVAEIPYAGAEFEAYQRRLAWLYAAAPALLEACEAIQDAWEGGEVGDWRGALDEALRLARAAIALAKETP